MVDDEPRSDDADAVGVRRPVALPTWRELLERALTGDRRRLARFGAVGLLVVGAAVAGYAVLRTPPAPATELTLPFAGSGVAGAATSTVPASTTTVPSELVVHAAGAVVVPGVHRLPVGSRVADLLAAAGGPAPDTDLDRVNLAAALADGERVWFPRIGEQTPPAVAVIDSGTGSSPSAGDDGPVNLNAATADQLDTLPGVGPATAAAILEHRERHGPFSSVEELLDVPGIGDAKLSQLRDLVTV